MADRTSIEWTDATWNPITGCTLVSEGCRHCYAATLAAGRLRNHPSRAGLARVNAAGEAKFTGEVHLNEQWLDQPLRWSKPRRIFVCAHGDLFHGSVPNDWIDRVFAVMALAPQHTFQVLTKRPERARDYLSLRALKHIDAAALAVNLPPPFSGGDAEMARPWPLPNVWLGTSVEDQATADERIHFLRNAPAAVRFISYEPALGPVDFTRLGTSFPGTYVDCLNGTFDDNGRVYPREGGAPAIDWVIVGGESGRGARPMHPDWARSLRDQCATAGVAYFFKQNGAWATVYDRDLEDPDWRRCDEVARETPNGRWLNLAGGQGFHGDRVLRVVPVGKAAAGRLLDGREHNEVPHG